MNPERSRCWSVFITVAVCATVAVLHALPQAQHTTPTATFRSGVTHVEVDAVVTDEGGRFVPGLRAEDFVLLDDGQPQAISTFSLVDLPLRVSDQKRARIEDREQDTTSNEDVRLGRLYVVVLDDQHTAPFLSQRTRTMVRRFVEGYVGPDDLVAVLSTAPDNRIVTDFTSSHDTLLAAVDRFVGRKPSWTPPGGTEASRAQVACFT